MLGLPGSIVDAIQNGPEGAAPAAVSMAGISPVDGSVIIAERAFQFWPESLAEEAEIGWSFKEIPGLSHSLAQWTQNGGRTFTFELQLSRYMRPFPDKLSWKEIRSFGQNRPNSRVPIDNRPMNISVKEQIQWLRQFYLPDYVESTIAGETYMTSQPPPIALLCFPQMGLNEDGSDVIWGVMTQCSVTYALCFPTGEPRMASISLGFKQVIQHPVNGLIRKSRSLYGENNSREENIARGGGRPLNEWTMVGP